MRMLAVWACAVALALTPVRLCAQTMASSAAGAAPKAAYYYDPTVLDLADLIPNPPADRSLEQVAELAELHKIETARTPEEIAEAKADDSEEDIFVFKPVFGAWLNAKDLPALAQLDAHLRSEADVAAGPLKVQFARPRPYQADKTLHPVCGLTEKPNSYPSGHALTGYLGALTLAEMVPQKRVEILARADRYAHNRLVCGVHYPSDVEASRSVAYAIFGYMMATPKFRQDVAAAKIEVLSHVPKTAR
jgi:acid phosphatase (class A)